MNRYCERLGIKVPRLEDSLARRDARLFHLMVVALLEHGQPMTLEQIVARLERAGVRPGYGGARSTDLADSLKKAWHGMDPVYRDAQGRYGVNLDSGELDLLLWLLGLRPGRHESTPFPPPPPEIERINEQDKRKEELEAARLRRAMLRVVPTRGNIQAASLLDVGTRTIKTMIGEELADLPALLDAFDIVAGIAVRDALVALGLDADRWKLVDLAPPQKTITINRRGRTLRLTEDLILRSTTGISQPLGNPARIAGYLARGERGRLTRRLESDVKALHALYRFGILHRSVRVRWGFLDVMIAVRDWAHPGDLR